MLSKKVERKCNDQPLAIIVMRCIFRYAQKNLKNLSTTVHI